MQLFYFCTVIDFNFGYATAYVKNSDTALSFYLEATMQAMK